jgi:hypothetical protein
MDQEASMVTRFLGGVILVISFIAIFAIEDKSFLMAILAAAFFGAACLVKR